VEKITTVVPFLSNCGKFKILSLVFVLAAESEMKFEMPSEMETGTAQSCRSGK